MIAMPYSHRRARSPGQALAEFALVIPVFLLLFFAAIDLGRAVFAYNSMTNAAREGARVAIVNQDSALIAQRVVGQASLAGATNPNTTVTFRRTTPNADFTTNPVCSPLAINCVAIVTFEATYRPITPIVSNIIFGSGVIFRAQSTGVIEFVCPNGSIPNPASCPRQP